jgi:hypothetical protein
VAWGSGHVVIGDRRVVDDVLHEMVKVAVIGA